MELKQHHVVVKASHLPEKHGRRTTQQPSPRRIVGPPVLAAAPSSIRNMPAPRAGM